jgi:hypothetical protein
MFPWQYGNSFSSISGGVYYPISGDSGSPSGGVNVGGVWTSTPYPTYGTPVYYPGVGGTPGYSTYGSSNLLLILIVVVAAILILK